MKHTTINEYFEYLEQNISPNAELYQAVHSYLEKQRGNAASDEKRPFLSVITRTQGKRPQMLNEMLLCLTAQSNPDFELLIMGHNLNDEQRETVRRSIDDLPQDMKSKTKLIEVTGGTRATPLNAGFEAANGRYIVILDDDDVVFDNWVDTFYQLSKEHEGKTLHSYAVLQDWEIVSKDGKRIPRAVGAPQRRFCRRFAMLTQLSTNLCPQGSLAYPAYAFKELGIRFNESFTTTEDWDFLMRTIFLTGVADADTVTFIYRNWINTENSQTLHSKDEWNHNYKAIADYFNKIPIVMPPRFMKNGAGEEECDIQFNANFVIPEATVIFPDYGDGFLTKRFVPGTPAAENDDGYSISFDGFSDSKAVYALKLDLKYVSGFYMGNFKLKITDADGNETVYSLSDFAHTGIPVAQGAAFLTEEPHMILRLKTPVFIRGIKADYIIERPLSQAVVDIITKRHNIFYRILRHVWRKFKSIAKGR